MGGMEIFWLILLVIFVVIEAITLSLVTIWFAVGAVAAFIAAMLGAESTTQWIIGIVVSAVVLLICRPIARKQMQKGLEPTNVDSMVGKTCLVKEGINNLKETGQVLIGDLEWSARSTDDNVIIAVDEKVVIERVEGVKVFVKKA